MNKTLEDFARFEIKRTIHECTPEQQLVFKKMYSHKDLNKPINDAVRDMPSEKLSHALTQIQRTLET